MRMSTTYIPRLAGLAGLAGVDPHEISGRVMVDGQPVLYSKAAMVYKGKVWIISDDQDFIVNSLGAPIGAIINSTLVPLDQMTPEQHAKFQPKYGYKVIPVSPATGKGETGLGFGFHFSLPRIPIPHPHINLPSRQAVLKVGRVAAIAAATYFTAGAAAGLLKEQLAKAAMAKLMGGGGGAPADAGAMPADGGPAPTEAGVEPAAAPGAPGTVAPAKKAGLGTWATIAAASLLLL